MKQYPGFSTSTQEKILEILKNYFPKLYEQLNQDPSGPLAAIVAIESFLTEGLIEHARALLKEQFLSTAQTTDAIVNIAVESGYTPQFAKPAGGIANLIIPIYNQTKNQPVIKHARVTLLRDTNTLEGLQLFTNDKIPYSLKSNYLIAISPTTTAVVKFRETADRGEFLTVQQGTYTIAGNSYEALVVPLEVEQVELFEQSFHAEDAGNGLVTVDIPFTIENLAELEVYIDGEKAELVPLLSLFRDDKYCFTFRATENGMVLILSNPIFGRPVEPGTVVKVVTKKTLGDQGAIKENSLSFVVQPYNEIEKSQLTIYKILHESFRNGKSLKVLKADVYTFIQRSKRAITEVDYFNLVKRELDVDSLSVPRQGLASNQVATYLAVPYEIQTELGLKKYIRTTTKAIVLTQQDLERFASRQGTYYVLKVPLAVTEDYSIHPSGYYCRPIGVYKPEELSSLDLSVSQKQTFWYPIFTYRLDLSEMFFNHSILDVSTSTSYTILSRVSGGFFLGYAVRGVLEDFLLGSTQDTFTIEGVVTLELGLATDSACSILQVSEGETNISSKIRIRLEDITGNLLPQVYFTGQNNNVLQVLKCEGNKIKLRFSFNIPITYAILQIQPALLKLSVELGKKSQLRKVLDFYISNFSIFRSAPFEPQVATKEAVRQIVGNYIKLNDSDKIVIYDVPLIHYTHYNQLMLNEIKSHLYRAYDLLQNTSPLTVQNVILPAQTYGYAFHITPYNFRRHGIQIDKEGKLIKLPLTIKADLAIYRDSNTSEVVGNIKRALYRLVNNKPNLLVSNISKHEIYNAIVDVPNLISFELQEPKEDIVSYPIHYFETIQFRVFVPYVKYLDEESFVFSIKLV